MSDPPGAGPADSTSKSKTARGKSRERLRGAIAAATAEHLAAYEALMANPGDRSVQDRVGQAVKELLATRDEYFSALESVQGQGVVQASPAGQLRKAVAEVSPEERRRMADILREAEPRIIGNSEAITSLDELHAAAMAKRSVLVTGWDKPKPAAFVMNISGTALRNAFRRGMTLYERVK